MLIGENREVGAAGDEIIARTALGEEQAERLLVDLGLALEVRFPGPRENRSRLGQVGAEPEPKPVADADDLAVAHARAQRRRIEIGRNDALARVERKGAVEIGARRGRHHLAQLVVDAASQAIGIVPELLDLRGERAGAALAQTGIQRTAHLPHRREHKAMPLDRRVLPRIFVIEQRAVFDEQQRVHDQRRNGLEGSEQMLRIARLVERRAIAVVQREAGDFLFAINRVAVLGGELGQLRRRRGLPDDGKIAPFQRSR